MDKIITINFIDNYESQKEQFEKSVDSKLDFLKQDNDMTMFNLEKTKLLNHIKNNYQLESMIRQLLIEYGNRKYIADTDNLIEYFIKLPSSEYQDQLELQFTMRGLDRSIKSFYLPLSVFNLSKLLLENSFSDIENSIGIAIGKDNISLIEQLIKNKLLKADKDYLGSEKQYKNIRSKFGKLLHISGTDAFANITFVRCGNDMENKEAITFSNVYYSNKQDIIHYCETFTLTKACLNFLGNYFNEKQNELKAKQEALSKKQTEHCLLEEIKETENKLKELKQKQKELKQS